MAAQAGIAQAVTCGAKAAGANGTGEVQAHPLAGSGGAPAGQGRSSKRTGMDPASSDGKAESSGPNRPATPARGKALELHVSAARRPTATHRAAADAQARVASILDPAGEECRHWAGRLGPAPGAAISNHSPTTGRQATGKRSAHEPARLRTVRAVAGGRGQLSWRRQPPGRSVGRARRGASLSRA